MIGVMVRENIDQALKLLKKKGQKEGILSELRTRLYYEKPSTKKKREQADNIRRARKSDRKRADKVGF